MPGVAQISRSQLDVLGRLGVGSGFVVSLPTRLVRRTEPLLLLVKHVVSAIDPVASLFAHAASLLPRSFGAFLRLGANCVAHFIAGARRVQHADYSSDAQTRQEPQETVAVTIRHNYLLNLSVYAMVAP